MRLCLALPLVASAENSCRRFGRQVLRRDYITRHTVRCDLVASGQGRRLACLAVRISV
jgi:hypothetical protein